MNETILKATHEALGARLVPFGGFHMPVQYRGILEEARTVRTAAGLFDLGHMGRIAVTGADAEAFLQRLQTNDAAAIAPGRIRYAMILDDAGYTQDDILVYRENDGDGFFLVVNASNTARDLEIMRRVAADFARVNIDDQTATLGMVALQGPASSAITSAVTDLPLDDLQYYAWMRGEIVGVEGALSRTGYTGEDGFEFYLPQSSIVELWDALLAAGREHGLEPCGLGSRDILRLEAGMPLYGHEIDELTTPIDAGLTFAVKFTHDFIGRPALERQMASGGPNRCLVGLTTTSRRVPRQGYTLHARGREIGKVCSGGASPTLGINIATGYVPTEFRAPGTALEFSVRDKREPAAIVALPFYKRPR